MAKNQSLSALDRPYTEPAIVSSMTLARLLETYQPGDLRYHFEPELAKQQLKDATQSQVKQFYDQFFMTNHAQIAVTGDFDAIKMQKTLENAFGKWKTKQPYQKIVTPFVAFKAQKFMPYLSNVSLEVIKVCSQFQLALIIQMRLH